MGRRRKTLDPDQLDLVSKYAGQGMTQARIAARLGISERTLRQRFLDDPAVLAAYQKGKAVMEEEVTGKAMEQVRAGNTAMIIFTLKTQFGWRETDRLELTGARGGPVQTQELSPTEMRHRLVARLHGVAERLTGVRVPTGPLGPDGSNGNGNGSTGHG